MKVSKVLICLIGMPSFFLSSNGRTILGIELELQKKCVLQSCSDSKVDESNEAEIEETFEAAQEKADSAIEGLFDYALVNKDKEYINFITEGSAPLEDRNDSFVFSMQSFQDRFSEAVKYSEEYEETDESFQNLRVLCDSGFSADESVISYHEDFVCDQGMVDFLTNLNGEYQYGLSDSIPETILNPEYLDTYSVYENVLEDYESGEETEAQNDKTIKKSPRIAAVATLTNTLLNQGLCYSAVATIKASFLSVKAAVNYWLPFVARAAIIAAAIVALTIVFVTYWKQIRQIVQAIVDMFISVAQGFADQISKVFDKVIKKSSDSDYDKKIDVDGTIYKVKIVDGLLEKTFSEYGNKVYHRAFIIDHLVFICMDRMEKEIASWIMQIANEKHFHNVYTYKQNDARRVMESAFPGARIFVDINNSKEYIGDYVLKHYHADYSSSGKNHDIANHSFFGQPVLVGTYY